MGWWVFFFQAEDGIRDVERSRGLGDVYKRQLLGCVAALQNAGNKDIVVMGTDMSVELAKLSLIHI
nr:hypothetical protein [Clostridium sp. C105KSO13]